MHDSQNVANIIKSLLKEKKVTVSQMLSDCELNKNALYTMQSSGYLPRVEALVRIADYLDCSVDYLLGRADSSEAGQSSQSVLTAQEKALLDAFRAVGEETQLEMVHAVYTIRDKAKKEDFTPSESSVG